MKKQKNKSSCGQIQSVERLNSQDTLNQKKSMTQKEINDYLTSIIETNVELFGLEKEIAASFIQNREASLTISTKLVSLKKEIEKGNELFHELKGRIGESSSALIFAENERRNE